jgi:glycosyltransferase involved in cell wall biosynthesis
VRKVKTMKILLLNYEFPPLGGGGGVAAREIAKGFIVKGYRVDCVTSWFPGLEKEEVVDGIRVHRVKVLGRKEKQTASILSLVSFPFLALPKVIQLCRQNDYSFVNVHFAVPTGPLGVVVSKVFGLKSILNLHGGDIYDPTKKSSPHRTWYLRKIVGWVLNNSDVIVAQSSATKKKVIELYAPDKEVFVVPLPYSSYVFQNLPEEYLRIKKDEKCIIGVGRLIKRKGFDCLIRALSKIKGKKTKLVLVGDGPEKKNLMDLARELNVSERVLFPGFVSDEEKFQYLSNSDLFVLSSVYEPFGVVIQEAMQAGLPIVATNAGGASDLIVEGVNGYLVSPGDDDSLADRIERILSDDRVREDMGKKSLASLSGYSPERIIEEYLRLVGSETEEVV